MRRFGVPVLDDGLNRIANTRIGQRVRWEFSGLKLWLQGDGPTEGERLYASVAIAIYEIGYDELVRRSRAGDTKAADYLVGLTDDDWRFIEAEARASVRALNSPSRAIR